MDKGKGLKNWLIMYQPGSKGLKEAAREIFLNLSWWKMTRLCHEMKKNLFSFMAAKFQKTHLAWSTVQMRTIDDLTEDTCHEGDRVQTRYFPLKTHLICYSIKPATLNIWINAESFWVQCPTFITPLSPGLTRAPKAQGDWVWVSLTPHLWCL